MNDLPLSKLLCSIALLSLLTGCDDLPDLVPAENFRESAAISAEANGWKLTLDSGLVIAGPTEISLPAKAIRVAGGAWVCADAQGAAVYDEAAKAWTTFLWHDAIPDSFDILCDAFDARALDDAQVFVSVLDAQNELCVGGPSGWSCQPVAAGEVFDLALTKTKTWLSDWTSPDAPVLVVVDEKGTSEVALPAGSDYALAPVRDGDAVFLRGYDPEKDVSYYVQVMDGEARRVDLPRLRSDDTWWITPVSPGDVYAIDSYSDGDGTCSLSGLDLRCTGTVNWSETTVYRVQDGAATPLARHREDGAAWLALGQLQRGQLFVEAGRWYTLPE